MGNSSLLHRLKLLNQIEARQYLELKYKALKSGFQERLEKIVDDYNSGSTNIERYFKELTELLEKLREEEKRHIKEGLTEEELAIFDILTKPKLKLSKKKEQKIKTVVKELLEKLKEQKFVLDWKKRTRTRADVQVTIEDMLWDKLPEPPYTQEI
jgi:type I restriction enzyme R subunit